MRDKKFFMDKKKNEKMFSWNSKKHENLSNCFDLKDKKIKTKKMLFDIFQIENLFIY